MARASHKAPPAAKTSSATKPAPATRKKTARVAAPAKASPAKAIAPTKAAATPPSRSVAQSSKARPAAARKTVVKAAAPAVTPAPKLSKDELRAQVEKLEHANATLRTKSRDMTRAAKAANTRIGELEAEIARLQGQAARQATAAKPAKSAKAAGSARQPRKREIDPGDAVPPGVAVIAPEPLDAEAEAARGALQEHIPGA